jgi:predicted  nucleic acid-binding Zn-ribbon protein
MSPDLERLVQLQRLETIIAEARGAMSSYPTRLAEFDERLNAVRQVVDAARQRMKDSQEARRASEKDAAVYQGRLTKFKDQLAGVKTNREFQAMQVEINTAQRELGVAEEKVLERMVEADDLAADVKKAEATFAEQEKLTSADRKEITDDLAVIETSLAQALERKAALIEQIEPRLSSLFEQVAKRKGIAICMATRDGLCSVCHVRLRPQVFQRVRANDDIIQCDSCNRILYYVPPPPPIDPARTHAP